jgi:hypothetical protein
MRIRSLVQIAVAFCVGISIGVFFPETSPENGIASPGAQSDLSAEQSNRTMKESAFDSPVATLLRPRARSTPTLEREEMLPSRGRTAQQLVDSWDSPGIDRDETAGRAGRRLDYSAPIEEEGAAEDFERFHDGPVSAASKKREEAESGTMKNASSTDLERKREIESCVASFSRCRQDVDCCGASVCRSRPGTISGHFVCTAD